jgi:hypothetical protein
MRLTVENKLDIDDVLYTSPAGPIMVLDVLYGLSVEIESSGQDFYAHKTGFTQKSLLAALDRAGFSMASSKLEYLEVNVIAFKGDPNSNTRALFDIPNSN